jgi:eukaryotic-like serine/threonine-protein kinase
MADSAAEIRVVGRYALHGELAAGGMAAVHLGRLLGPVGFARTVAIKRLHSQHARDPDFVAMFLDEARLVSRIKHPNVVPTLDVVTLDGEIFIVMEYVHGAPVSRIMMTLARRKERMPVNVAVAVGLALLEGLHAAHEATNEEGDPLGIVHRDVSPQNVLIGADGVTRVLDFGIAKAAERIQTTEDGSFKGKLGYMPPDVLSGAPSDRRADLWGAGVVIWEMLVGKRLFQNNESPHSLIRTIVEGNIDPPSKRGVELPATLDAVVMKALQKLAADRFQTAREMANALEEAVPPASNRVVGEWLKRLMGDELDKRAAEVAQMERASRAARPSVGTVRTLAATTGSFPPAILPPDPTTATPVFLQAPPPEPPPKKGRSTVALLSLLFGALFVTGTVLGARAIWQRTHPISATSAPTTTLPPPSTEVPPPPSAASSLATGASGPPSASVPSSVAGPTSVPSAPSAKPPPLRPPPGHQTPPKSCNPPYTIGPPPDYIRKPKLECLPR